MDPINIRLIAPALGPVIAYLCSSLGLRQVDLCLLQRFVDLCLLVTHLLWNLMKHNKTQFYEIDNSSISVCCVFYGRTPTNTPAGEGVLIDGFFFSFGPKEIPIRNKQESFQ